MSCHVHITRRGDMTIVVASVPMCSETRLCRSAVLTHLDQVGYEPNRGSYCPKNVS
jgi:hypothetical protein